MKPPRVSASEVVFSAIRAQGAGGQNVNKVSNAAHLRFDIHRSTLPEALKVRLLAWPDRRIGADGVIVIKAQDHRSLPRNQLDALERLQALIDDAAHIPKTRRPTRPTHGSQQRRLDSKSRHSQTKAGRRHLPD